METPFHSRSSMLKSTHFSKTMSAEQRSTFAAIHRHRYCLYLGEKFSSGTKKIPQTNKQTHTQTHKHTNKRTNKQSNNKEVH